MREQELMALVKVAAYNAHRRNIIRRSIKEACAVNTLQMSLEKLAANANALISPFSKSLGRTVQRVGTFFRPGTNANLVERLGSRVQQRGIPDTARVVGRRMRAAGRNYWGNLTGANERAVYQDLGNTPEELIAAGKKSLQGIEEGVTRSGGKFNSKGLARSDAEIASRVRSNAKALQKERIDMLSSGMLDSPEVANEYLKATENLEHEGYDAIARQAYRARRARNNARLYTGAAAVPATAIGLNYALGSDDLSTRTPSRVTYRMRGT